MVDIIPAINCLDWQCVQPKVRAAERFAEWIHLDVADGSFTFNKTWRDPLAWRELGTSLKLEVHLMVEHPEKFAEDWLRAGAHRIIFHVEALEHNAVHEILEIGKSYGAHVMLASNPETKLEELVSYFKQFSEFQALAVHPGFAGQKFLPLVLQKVKALREKLPHATIEIDGGITAEIAKAARIAGASIIVSASYIWSSADPKKAYESLKYS